MAQIAAGDVTYSAIQGLATACPSDPEKKQGMVISFGDGTLTYTNGGIPLTKAKLGCPAVIKEFIIMDSGHGNGYVAKYNYTASTIKLYQDANVTAAAAAALVEVLTSAAVTATTLRVIVSGW